MINNGIFARHLRLERGIVLPTFSAVHGTDSVCATAIQNDGFKIARQPPGQLMYGNGVYFYEDSPAGEKAACFWPYHWQGGRKPVPPHMRLYASILYAGDKCLSWTSEREGQVRERMAVLRTSTGSPLSREEKNRQRCRIIAAAAAKMGVRPDIILTHFPTDYDPPWSGLAMTAGCVVINEDLLPPPPFRIASCGAL